MNSTQQDSSDFVASNRVMKGEMAEKQTRRSWSSREEAVLLASLKELMANGWKSNNGFRRGYLAKMEDTIAKEFPGTDIKGQSHISSKLTIWKKNYGSFTLMLARSGVGFNVHGNHQIDCTKEQWDQICKLDVNAKTMRRKSWPMFDDWKVVFGKDRTTGEGAEDVMDAVKEINQEKDKTRVEDKEEDYDFQQKTQNMSYEAMGENNTCNSEKNVETVKSLGKNKKRKVVDPVDKVTELFLSITRGTHDRLDKIMSRIGYKYDVDEAKKAAFHLLDDMPFQSFKDKFIVTEIFVKDHDRLLIFKDLPEEAKLEYIQHLLTSNPT